MLSVMVSNLHSSSLQCSKPASILQPTYLHLFVCYFSFAVSHLLSHPTPNVFAPIYLPSLYPPFYTLPHAHHPFNSLTPHPSSPPLPLHPTNTLPKTAPPKQSPTASKKSNPPPPQPPTPTPRPQPPAPPKPPLLKNPVPPPPKKQPPTAKARPRRRRAKRLNASMMRWRMAAM